MLLRFCLLQFIILLLVISPYALAQYSLDEREYFDGKLSVQTPAPFLEASQALIKQRFVDEATRPQIILTDKDERVLMSMSLVPNQGDRQTLIHFFRDIKNAIRESYPEHQFLKTDVIRNRTLAIVEVLLPNQDGEMLYNMMAFSYVGEDFFSFNFSTPADEIAKWQNTAREIAENIKVAK